MKQADVSVEARLQSFVYAGRGVNTLLASHTTPGFHAATTVVVVVGGLAARLTRFEWLALVVALVFGLDSRSHESRVRVFV